MTLGQKLRELIYLLSTDDKYSEYDSRKSFNRVNKPDTENLLGGASGRGVNTNYATGSHGSENSSSSGGSFEMASNLASGQENNNPDAGVHEMKLAWRHIKHWLHKNAPDINSSLSSKCTSDDLRDFQKDLNITLPNCVVAFFKLTDGQSNFGSSLNIETNGLIFGLKLMSLDEIMVQTENWRKVSDYINNEARLENYKSNNLSKLPTSHANNGQYQKKIGLGVGVNTSSTTNLININNNNNNSSNNNNNNNNSNNNINNNNSNNNNINTSEMSSRRTSFDLSQVESRSSTSTTSHDASNIETATKKHKTKKMPRQRAIPPGTIHETFAHPMWIPMVTDEVGNYIGIDLCPASQGVMGQVILFGRDFDFKFQIAETWGDFLLIFANDLEMGNWDIKINKKNNYGDLFIGSEGDLVFVDKESSLEIPYLEILKRRAVKKWMSSLDLEKNIKIQNEGASKESDKGANNELVRELKEHEQSILTLSNKNYQSIDTFINKNLDIIDNMKKSEVEQPIEIFTSKSSKQNKDNNIRPASLGKEKVSGKSPLSQEVTLEVNEADPVRVKGNNTSATASEQILENIDIKD
ncbi:Cell wall assembly regulator [Lodderomyces elongisporus]|uniref:Cell wall assembly regulator n=1 Tax=Lodderomyces elongisporus TaxID=36914 RepID=UPI0029263746|nr:Cell wall assembly regulator [Lodderomyces elongisporus]WLF79910.1 Cell wall assembly regulator [Lodderomyces elongisporus]